MIFPKWHCMDILMPESESALFRSYTWNITWRCSVSDLEMTQCGVCKYGVTKYERVLWCLKSLRIPLILIDLWSLWHHGDWRDTVPFFTAVERTRNLIINPKCIAVSNSSPHCITWSITILFCNSQWWTTLFNEISQQHNHVWNSHFIRAFSLFLVVHHVKRYPIKMSLMTLVWLTKLCSCHCRLCYSK